MSENVEKNNGRMAVGLLALLILLGATASFAWFIDHQNPEVPYVPFHADHSEPYFHPQEHDGS